MLLLKVYKKKSKRGKLRRVEQRISRKESWWRNVTERHKMMMPLHHFILSIVQPFRFFSRFLLDLHFQHAMWYHKRKDVCDYDSVLNIAGIYIVQFISVTWANHRQSCLEKHSFSRTSCYYFSLFFSCHISPFLFPLSPIHCWQVCWCMGSCVYALYTLSTSG